MIDVERARAETPGVQRCLHFNNCGSALMPIPVLEAVKGHLDLEAQIGGYEAAEQESDRLEGSYRAVARLLNCSPDEVAVVENATRAWDMVFYGFDLKEGDRILTATCEYASNYIAYLQVARRTGAVVEVVPDDDSGQLDVEALERMIDGRTRLISVTHVPTNGGLVNPIGEIGEVARRRGVPFLVDACQSAGQLDLDVEAMKIDMLSATSRKYLRGPRGVGFLYVRRDWIERLEPPFLDLHSAAWTESDRYEIRSDARRFENFEANVAGKVGLGVAVDYALGWGIDAIESRVRGLAAQLRERLMELPGVTVLDLGQRPCGIVSFSLDRLAPRRIQDELARRRINVSVSVREGTLIDMDRRGLSSFIRAGVHYYNDENEIDRFVRALAEIN